MSIEKRSGKSERAWDSKPKEEATSQELAVMEKLFGADGEGRWDEPRTADELLTIGEGVFEPLFHEPPVGPVPEYLAVHFSVYGCVAEYEERLEELDRWKAVQLGLWLESRIGKRWCTAGKVYELHASPENGNASRTFWFTAIDCRSDAVT